MGLEVVKQCCQAMRSEKVLERKNASESLRHLLNNSSIITALNGRSNDKFNWSHVFFSAHKYFLMEARKLEEEERKKTSVSQTVLHRREYRKRKAASLPLLVLKKACQATPQVRPQLVIDLVLKVLNKREPYLLENFAGEFLQVTLKFVLHFHQYYTEMTTENWKELLKISIWLYEKSVPNTDPQSIFVLMGGIIQHCQASDCQQRVPTCLKVLYYLPTFLHKALLSDRLSLQYSLRSSLLKLLLAFTSAMACEWRQLLCRLGEDTFDVVLAMWKDQPSGKHTHWLEYMTLMVALHHPQKDGEVCDSIQHNGDSMRWQRCLRQLYQLLYDHLAMMVNRGLSDDMSKPLLVLATRVCMQIFICTETTGFIDVTQISDSSGGSRKRRKIVVGLMPLADLLRSEGTARQIVPWYHILLSLLKEHPRFFKMERCMVLLKALTQVLRKCNDWVVQDVVMRCLSCLAKQFSRVKVALQGDAKEHKEPDMWVVVWDLVLRIVIGRQRCASGLALIGTLIIRSLVIPESSVFEQFDQNHLDTSEEALWILLALLIAVPLPQHFENEFHLLRKSQMKEVREMLILHALPTPNTMGAVAGARDELSNLKNVPLLATVLGCLCLREPHTVEISLDSFNNNNHHHHHHHCSGNHTVISKMEDLFHLSTFTCTLTYATQVQCTSQDPPTPHKPTVVLGGGGGALKDKSVIPEKLEFMIQQVLAFAERVEAKHNTSPQENIEVLIQFAHLLTLLYLNHGDKRLEGKFRHIMLLITSSLDKMCAETEASQWFTLHPILACLLYFYMDPAEAKDEESGGRLRRERRKHIFSSTPPSLFTVMLSLFERRCVKAGTSAGSSQLPRESSMNQSSINDFYLEYDDTLASSSDALNEIFEFGGSFSNQEDANITVDEPTTYSERDQCVVLAGRWLVEAATVADAVTPSGGGGAGDIQHFFLHRAIDVVLQLSLSSEMKMSDVAVMLAFVQSLFVTEYSEEYILDGLKLISNIAKVYCCVTQVARCALNILEELIHEHGSRLSPDIRTSILTLTKGFATKQHKGSYGPSVAVAIFHVNTELTKIDPWRQWSHYEVPEHDRCCKIQDFLCSNNHELRVGAAAATHLLLVSGGVGGTQLDASHQDRVFEEVYQMVLEALNVPDLVSEDFTPDEKSNRIASFLLALGCVALSSPYLEGKALFALCLSVPLQKIDISLLLQLLTSIAKSRDTSPKTILTSNVAYLTSQWLQHQYDIEAFPFTMFGYQSRDAFLRENKKDLLPILLEYDQRAAVDTLAESCNKSVREMFVDAFPLIMAHIFVYIAAEQANTEGLQMPDAKIQAGKRQYKQVERTLGTETFTSMLTEHIADITLHLLHLAHDPHLWVEEVVVVPHPPPTFPLEAIHATLNFVGGIFRQDGLLLVFLASRRKELHKVLLGLQEHLSQVTSPHTARWALSATATLVEAVLPHLSLQLLQVSHYLVRMLLHLLSCRLAHLGHLGSHLAHRCLGLLQCVVAAVLTHLPTHVTPALPWLYGRLLPLLTQQPWGTVGLEAVKVLDLLLDSDHPEVRATLATLPALPTLPDNPMLAALHIKHQQVVADCRGQPDLLDEVDNFLAIPQEALATHHHLAHLTSLVKAARGQVAELFDRALLGQESRGHLLAHRLVCLSAKGREEVALEACRCLGEMGPLFHATPVFRTSNGGLQQVQKKGEVDLGYMGHILLAMNHYLTCGDVQMERVASQAMMDVLATHHGYQALQGLPHTTVEEFRPFLPEGRPRMGAAGSKAVDAATYQQMVEDEEVWLEHGGYEVWLCGLVGTLITAGCGTEVATPLLPLCTLQPEFSVLLLPFLVHAALITDTGGGRRDVLSRQFSAFFARHGTSSPGTAFGGSQHVKTAIQALLTVVDHLRLQQPQLCLKGRQASTPFDNNLWLDMNYLHLAQVADRCGAHLSALLYLQLHYEQMLRETPLERGCAAITRRLQAPPIARVATHPEAGTAEQLLLEVYRALGDLAGARSCLITRDVPDAPARLMRYQHRGKWLLALAVCDVSRHQPGLTDTLASLCFYNSLGLTLVAGDSLDGTSSPPPGKSPWESAWRLCRWNEEGGDYKPGRGICPREEGDLQQHLFWALRSFHHQNMTAVHQHTILARRTITKTLCLSRAESTSITYPILTQLQVLNELEEATRCLGDLTSDEKVCLCALDMEEGWRAKENMGHVGYKYKEEIMAARISTLKVLSGLCKEKELQCILLRMLLAKSKLARLHVVGGKASHGIPGSESAMLSVSQLAMPPQLANLTRLEEAEVAKGVGDIQRATDILQELLGDMEGQKGRSQERALSQVLTVLGELLMDAGSLPPLTIIEDYFNRATSILLHHAADKESHDVLENNHQRLAQYFDQHYQEIHDYLKSNTTRAMRANIQQSQVEVSMFDKLIKCCTENDDELKELSKKKGLLEKSIELDCEFLSKLEKDEQHFLLIAFKAYLRYLSMTSKQDLHMHRVVALWLRNYKNEKINDKMSDLGSNVKSFHYVPLLYQLVARLSTHHTQQPLSFPSILLQLVMRLCVEHPHHGLPVIFAMAHAHADDKFIHVGQEEGAPVLEEDRVEAAKMLVERLKRMPGLQEHVIEFECISLAYLSLANWSGSLGQLHAGDKVEIPRSQHLRSLSHMKHTAALTQPLKIQPSAQYGPALIQDWEKSGMCVGGINAPMRLTIRTSDGVKYFELLKGKDDVRQDAVMEQVFGVVNELLMKSEETKDYGLSVRTYQVVPLSQRSGLIQWCRNTQAFGRYLTGADKKSGAHKVYYPKDYSARTCLDKMKAVKEHSPEEKIKVFVNILENFHPVFHHFFLENYPSPHEWHQRRLAYTKSVATNSMVGYILGLGDRHPENILLDKSTAELIHIDLGIAFDLGKVLPTPETVPFRMTQDIVAGLGVLGVDGPLRGWCEATLGVLRANEEVVLTIVEVLRHDPLHLWTLTPQQEARLQAKGEKEKKEDKGPVHQTTVSMAERVVLSVREKLGGREDGLPCSVHDQVTRLLQAATNPANLSRLFSGWQPYL